METYFQVNPFLVLLKNFDHYLKISTKFHPIFVHVLEMKSQLLLFEMFYLLLFGYALCYWDPDWPNLFHGEPTQPFFYGNLIELGHKREKRCGKSKLEWAGFLIIRFLFFVAFKQTKSRCLLMCGALNHLFISAINSMMIKLESMRFKGKRCYELDCYIL